MDPGYFTILWIKKQESWKKAKEKGKNVKVNYKKKKDKTYLDEKFVTWKHLKYTQMENSHFIWLIGYFLLRLFVFYTQSDV